MLRTSTTTSLLGCVIILSCILPRISSLKKPYCPSRCTCDTTSIKCIEELLTTVPDFRKLTTRPKVIDVSVNDIEEIKLTHFYSKNLQMVKRLLLKDNSIYLVEVSAFAALPNLQYLDLSNNLLEEIPYDVLRKNPKVTKLNLSGNLFGSKPPTLISSSLKSLDLSVCKISTFTDSNLKGLPNLESLYLYANNLKFIDYDLFVSSRLIKIDLFYNPWRCTCDTIRLFNFLVSKNMTTIDRPIQCLHEDKWYQDIYYTGDLPEVNSLCVKKVETKNEKLLKINDNTNTISSNKTTVTNETNLYTNVTHYTIPTDIIIIISIVSSSLMLSAIICLVLVLKKINTRKALYTEIILL